MAKAIGHTEDGYNYFVTFDDGTTVPVLKSGVRLNPTWQILAMAAGDTSAWDAVVEAVKRGNAPAFEVSPVMPVLDTEAESQIDEHEIREEVGGAPLEEVSHG